MSYDTAVMEIIVRTVALSAFVETPRDVAIIAEGGPGRFRLAAAKATRGGLSGGLRLLGRGLALAGERLSGLADAIRPGGGRCPA